MIFILRPRSARRALHWREIKSRVTTHEGELLTGREGRKYQDKYSKKYLGRDMTGRYTVPVAVIEKLEKEKK